MKKMSQHSFSKATLLALSVFLCAGSTMLGQEKIRIYEGIVFSAKEISGSDIFAEPNDKYTTKIPDQLEAVTLDVLFTRVGSYRQNYRYKEVLPLFDMSNNSKHYPLLDKIDCDYYEDIAFDKLQKEKEFVKLYKTGFDKFLQGWKKAPSLEAKKDTLGVV